MSLHRRAPKVAVWSPLAPQHTGIAENVAEVLPELARLADVSVVVDDWLVGLAQAPNGTDLIGQSTYAARRGDFDLCVYHMGNHFGFHRGMYEELLRTPGLVVLHDVALVQFNHAALRAASPQLPVPGPHVTPTSELGPVVVGSSRRVVDASLAVLVHSEWAARQLRRHFPAARVVTGHLAAPGPSPDADPASVRRACGWDSEHFVVGALGGIAGHKRVDLALRAFVALRQALPMARLLIGGWVHDPAIADRLEALIAELDLQASVRFATDLEPVELDSCLLASDVVVDLRWSAAGEVAATPFRAFAAGRPAVVTDLPQLAELDPTFCRRVPVEASEAARAAALTLIELGRDRAATRRLGDAARVWATATTAPAVVAVEHRAAIDVALAASLPRAPEPTRAIDGRGIGLTVVGDLTATTGLMEAGRRLVLALESAGVALERMHAENYGASHNAARDETGLHARLPVGRSHETELWLANLNEFAGVADAALRPPGVNHRVIASWFWELPTVVEPYRSHIQRVDEIWVGSPFVRDTLQQYTAAPVVVVPVPIHLDVSVELERRAFGLADDDVVYFYDFDANSTAARKNPFGLIAAFSQAFPDPSAARPSPRLVVKGTNLHAHRGLRDALERNLAPIGGVLVDAELNRPEMNALLAMSDVYVSLHRAEGFGLGMVEAMYLGKPVIATVYPQLWIFPAAAAACPVRGRLRAITDADHAHFRDGAAVYRPGLAWAEPDTGHAAEWMSLLYRHPDLRRRVGTSGARLIREHYNLDAACTVMLERLRAGLAGTSHARVDHGAVPERLVSGR